jgi:hypothetical protein
MWLKMSQSTGEEGEISKEAVQCHQYHKMRLQIMEEARELNAIETEALGVRIQFLEETVQILQSTNPQKFTEVWKANTSLNKKFEDVVQKYKTSLDSMTAVNVGQEYTIKHLELSLKQLNEQYAKISNAQEAKKRNKDKAVSRFYSRRLEDAQATIERLNAKVSGCTCMHL